MDDGALDDSISSGPEPASSSRKSRPVPRLSRGDDHPTGLSGDPRFGLVDVMPSSSDRPRSRSPTDDKGKRD